MKKYFLILLVLLLALSSCRTTKKATATKVVTTTAVASKEETTTTENTKITNDANTETTTTTKKITYNKPDPIDSTKLRPGEVNLPAKGSILSEEETITTTKQADKGKVETTKKEEVKKDITEKGDTKTDTKVTEAKKVPIQWWAIFGILVVFLILVVAAYLFFTKSPAGIAAKTFIKNL